MVDMSQPHLRYPAAPLWEDIQALQALAPQDPGGASRCAPALPILKHPL